ncbi:MAG: response regulator [Rhodobacteraceae bacterium]|nr:response regulator [Paracoccaceae bacterium]MCF8514738.1 response regulator [Paracoccaceae bacterium]MCF8518721.1 response regulator [Paracoccaceae bacterium]
MNGPHNRKAAPDAALPHWSWSLVGTAMQPQRAIDQPTEPGEAFVFRDFERSKVRAIRLAIEAYPLRYSIVFLAMVLFWTALMSAASGLHGNNSIALNLTPHIALYCAILGIFFYPFRLLWVPFATFVGVFAYPFFQPFVTEQPWYQTIGFELHLVWHLFALNIAAAGIIGMTMRVFFAYCEQHVRPHLADLWLCLFSYSVFVTICLLQLYLSIQTVPTFAPNLALRVGFDDDLAILTFNRIFRGGVVLTGFLLAAIEFPDRRELRLGLACATFFPTIGLLQSFGFSMYPMLDIALFAIVLVILLPVPSGILACIVGIPFYSAMTGQFLNDAVQTDPATILLERYSIIGITLVVFVLAFRSRSRHLLRSQDSSMRRLNRVRDFAGVGLFSINTSAGRYRVDSTASRILGCDLGGVIGEFLQCFDVDARDELTSVFARRRSSGDMLTIGVQGPKGNHAILQLLVWSEMADSGDDVTYGLMLDVTENSRRKEALQSALDQLSLREEKQRQLFSIVSHEVRTPASIISMLIDDLPADTMSTTQVQLREATDQLMSVLGDMRQAVNPDKNLPIRKEAFVPIQMGQSVVASLQKTASGVGITLVGTFGSGADVHRMGDTVRCRQVLTNLVRNALIHSGGQTVSLDYRIQHDRDGVAWSVWTITDDGDGIAPEDEAAIFEPFERGKAYHRKKKDGSGLGLFIARSAVTVLGGTLVYERVETGGARFIVSLPEPEATSCDMETHPSTVSKAPHDLAILMAEDNAIVAEVMSSRLRRDFASVTLAPDGDALLSEFEKSRPDVVLTDLFMPGLDGDEATAELRRRGFQGPIIGLTAAAVGEDWERFTRAGSNAVMFKPLDMRQLHTVLNQILQSGTKI